MAKYHPVNRKKLIWIALSLSLEMHLLAIWFWSTRSISLVLPHAKSTTLTVQLRPLREHERLAPQSADSASAKTNAPVKLPGSTPHRQVPVAPASRSALPESAMKEPPDTPVSTSAGADDMMQKAMRDVGKIDRELRQSAPELMQPPQSSIQSRLEKGIASAAKTDRPSMVEKTLPDGRRITKVTGVGGVYCVAYEGVGATGGIDQIARGIHGKVTSCGHLFD